MTLIHNGTKAFALYPDGMAIRTNGQKIVGTKAQIDAEIKRLNLVPPRGYVFEKMEPQQ
jgi:hypothetical protein